MRAVYQSRRACHLVAKEATKSVGRRQLATTADNRIFTAKTELRSTSRRIVSQWDNSLVITVRSHGNPIRYFSWAQQQSYFSTASDAQDPDHNTTTTSSEDSSPGPSMEQPIRLSKLLSQYTQNLALSRREAERLIRAGDVTVAGQICSTPHYLLDWKQLTPGLVQLQGKAVIFVDDPQKSANIAGNKKVWIVHKLKGEVVADFDPQGRPSMMERLQRGGVGKSRDGKKKQHLKAVGRLDITTEGLILVTTCGQYAREMELPSSELHRTYRVRVHGHLTQYKVRAIERGMRIDDAERNNSTKYAPMKVKVEGRRGSTSTNRWIQITCTEGKNRQIRNVLQHLGLTVTRLIRVSFGDYQLQTIPPGMALEVPLKPIKQQTHKGPLFKQRTKKPKSSSPSQEETPPVQWVRHYR